MIRSLLLRARAGARYQGPVAFADELHGKPIVRGYYALSADGKRLLRPLVRLVCVDDAPGDPEDGACHYEIARRSDPAQKAGRIVPLEFHGEGNGGLEA